MRYDYKIKHVAGKELYTADAFSRSPVEMSTLRDSELSVETECYANNILVNLPASDSRLNEIRRELKKDDTLTVIMHYVQYGWPQEKSKRHGPLSVYWKERGNMST